MNYKELERQAKSWIEDLRESGKSENTIKQYTKSLEWFFKYLNENEITEITKGTVNSYKNSMIEEIRQNQINPPQQPKGEKWKTERPLTKYSTANIRLKPVNALFRTLGKKDLIVDKIKESVSSVNNEIMTDLDYLKLLDYTRNEKMKLIIETLVFTGIRISELEGLTVESLKKRYYTVYNKSRARTVFIPKGLAKKLKTYCNESGIKSGTIFKNKAGNGMISQSYIRDEMKYSAGKARMKKSKAFPHSLRHLFAKHYSAMPDSDYYILPQLLGHSDATVTSVYTKLSVDELLKIVDGLEVFTNKRLKEAQKTRAKNKKIAEAKKRRNQKKKENIKVYEF